MSRLLVIGFSFGYLALLFGVAYAAERRSAARKSLVSNPYVYALSMAVYCTAWTYYGSVGRAAHHGLEFVGIYVGPTLLVPAWWLVLRKIIRVCRQQRLTSIADFISARYGKSAGLGALATGVCVLGIVPYIVLQIKAIAASFVTITGSSAGVGGPAATIALYTTGALAVFTVLFGVRSVEATERHEGIVLAVALESVLKLVAFLVLGVFVTFGLFHGFGDVFDQAAAVPALRQFTTADPRLLTYAEKLLAGSLGPASARMLVASVAGAEEISYESVVGILRESQQLLEANRQLQKQRRQLQRLTDERRAAYDQRQALDHRKDEFLYTVTHELRTPLTSIRALAEILADNPDLGEEERQRFQLTIGREAERLTRFISLVLDLKAPWTREPASLASCRCPRRPRRFRFTPPSLSA